VNTMKLPSAAGTGNDFYVGRQLPATTHAAGVSGIPVLYLWCNTPVSGVRLMPSQSARRLPVPLLARVAAVFVVLPFCSADRASARLELG